MLRPKNVHLQSLVTIMILTASICRSQGTSQLTPEGILPPLTGETMSGKSLNLPDASAGHTAVVIFSFSRNSGHDAQVWAEHLAKNDATFPIYNAIFLESVPRIFRSLAISGIRNRMPQTMLDRTLLAFHDQASWQQKLQASGDSAASVIVLDPSGHIRWVAHGPFTDALYLRLRSELRR